MLDSFKAVLEKEREAESIVVAARKKAKRIETDAQEKAELVYRETFQATIDEAKRQALEIKQKAKEQAETEAQFFVKQAETLRKNIEASSKQNFDEAVALVLKKFLS